MSPGNKAGTGRKSSVSFKSINAVELESASSSTGIHSSGRVFLSLIAEAYPVELDAMSAELSGLAAQVRSEECEKVRMEQCIEAAELLAQEAQALVLMLTTLLGAAANPSDNAAIVQ